MRRLLFILLFTVNLIACGQKGGLYIPQDEPAPTQPAQDPPSSGT